MCKKFDLFKVIILIIYYKMSIIKYYNSDKIEDNIIDYYNGCLENNLHINEEYINTLYEDRNYCESIINDTNKTEQEKRIAKNSILGMTSSASNDIYENQISKIFGITNIDTKHGWDGNDEENNEPYEYKPTKINNNKKYFGAKVNINDESDNKINNISSHKVAYNNYEANFVIAIIYKDTSEFICIYKFKEYILHRSRMDWLNDSIRLSRKRIVYGTNIKKCIELSKKYNEKYYYWHNPEFP